MDIDVDFANYGRYDVIEYCQGKYGYEKVCQIATFQTLGVKSIIKSVGKTLGMNFDETNEMTAQIPNKICVTERNEEGIMEEKEVPVELLSQLEEIPYFQEKLEKDDRLQELFEMGKVLEGLPSATGKHAAGVIIGRSDLMNYVPLMEVDGVMVSQFEKKAVESIGLLKMDFLGLQTLDVLHECMDLIKETERIHLSLDEIPMNDADTFRDIFQTGNTSKVFQFESEGMKKLLRRMKPTCMMDLCLANAAYRPGPMQFIDEFVAGRNNPESVHYPTKEYEEVAEETKGILFYQEQVMAIVQKMAGFTLGQADILRRGIGKKEKKYIDEGRERFVEGCKKMGTADEKLAKEIYANIEKFANYGFNKSHSDAYGLVAYLCGWFKEYYPAEFMAANSTICSNNVDKLSICLSEIKRMGIEILPPDVRYSQARFVIETNEKGDKAIRFSLSAVKAIREENASLFAGAKNKDSLYAFLSHLPDTSIRKNQILNLIHAGAFDYLGSRKGMAENLGTLIDAVKYQKKAEKNHLSSILSLIPFRNAKSEDEYPAIEKLKLEKNCIQTALSGHPLTPYRNLTNQFKYLVDYKKAMEESPDMFQEPVTLFALVSDTKSIVTKKGQNMMFLTLDDEYSSIEAVIFPRDYAALEEKGKIPHAGQPYMLTGKMKESQGYDGTWEMSMTVSDVDSVKNPCTLYIEDKYLSQEILDEFKKYNGIVPVVRVDTRKMTVEKLPFCIDLHPNIKTLLKGAVYRLKKG